IRSGAGRVNRAAFAIHAAVHARRSDVIASVHSHSPYGKAWSMLGQLLSPLSQDSCAFYQDHAVHHDFSGLVLDAEEGFTISDSLGQNKAVILQNHGLLTVGGSVGAAVWWFLAMEKACECEIHARSVRSPIVLSSEVAKVTREQIGTEYTGRFIFSALRAEYLAEHGTVEPGR
ncbi:MAG: class II aldolase/adducin family protein, partial [Acidimicrobiales bacterium]